MTDSDLLRLALLAFTAGLFIGFVLVVLNAR